MCRCSCSEHPVKRATESAFSKSKRQSSKVPPPSNVASLTLARIEASHEGTLLTRNELCTFISQAWDHTSGDMFASTDLSKQVLLNGTSYGASTVRIVSLSLLGGAVLGMLHLIRSCCLPPPPLVELPFLPEKCNQIQRYKIKLIKFKLKLRQDHSTFLEWWFVFLLFRVTIQSEHFFVLLYVSFKGSYF